MEVNRFVCNSWALLGKIDYDKEERVRAAVHVPPLIPHEQQAEESGSESAHNQREIRVDESGSVVVGGKSCLDHWTCHSTAEDDFKEKEDRNTWTVQELQSKIDDNNKEQKETNEDIVSCISYTQVYDKQYIWIGYVNGDLALFELLRDESQCTRLVERFRCIEAHKKGVTSISSLPLSLPLTLTATCGYDFMVRLWYNNYDSYNNLDTNGEQQKHLLDRNGREDCHGSSSLRDATTMMSFQTEELDCHEAVINCVSVSLTHAIPLPMPVVLSACTEGKLIASTLEFKKNAINNNTQNSHGENGDEISRLELFATSNILASHDTSVEAMTVVNLRGNNNTKNSCLQIWLGLKDGLITIYNVSTSNTEVESTLTPDSSVECNRILCEEIGRFENEHRCSISCISASTPSQSISQYTTRQVFSGDVDGHFICWSMTDMTSNINNNTDDNNNKENGSKKKYQITILYRIDCNTLQTPAASVSYNNDDAHAMIDYNIYASSVQKSGYITAIISFGWTVFCFTKKRTLVFTSKHMLQSSSGADLIHPINMTPSSIWLKEYYNEKYQAQLDECKLRCDEYKLQCNNYEKKCENYQHRCDDYIMELEKEKQATASMKKEMEELQQKLSDNDRKSAPLADSQPTSSSSSCCPCFRSSSRGKTKVHPQTA